MGRVRGIDGLDDLDLILNNEERIQQALDEEFDEDEEDMDLDWGEE